MLETKTWLTSPEPDGFVFKEIVGPTSYGLNLDGKVGANDFTSPTGEKGIDNQLYRALGCVIGFRGPDGVEYIFENKAIAQSRYNRTMIEITGVDSLVNDDDVKVTIYRGLDRLLTDATGNKVMPGGSQRVDEPLGQEADPDDSRQDQGRRAHHAAGEADDHPWMNLGVPTFQLIRDMRFQLKLTPPARKG